MCIVHVVALDASQRPPARQMPATSQVPPARQITPTSQLPPASDDVDAVNLQILRDLESEVRLSIMFILTLLSQSSFASVLQKNRC